MFETPITKFRNIDWLGTLKLSLARSIASGAVLAAIVAVIAPPDIHPLEMFVIWSLGSTFMLSLVYVLSLIFAPFGLVFGLLAIVVILGDPLIYAFNRMFPFVLNVSDFKLLNFHAFIIV